MLLIESYINIDNNKNHTYNIYWIVQLYIYNFVDGNIYYNFYYNLYLKYFNDFILFSVFVINNTLRL